MVAPKLRSFGSSTARILKGRSGVCETHSRRLPLSNLKRHPRQGYGRHAGTIELTPPSDS